LTKVFLSVEMSPELTAKNSLQLAHKYRELAMLQDSHHDIARLLELSSKYYSIYTKQLTDNILSNKSYQSNI